MAKNENAKVEKTENNVTANTTTKTVFSIMPKDSNDEGKQSIALAQIGMLQGALLTNLEKNLGAVRAESVRNINAIQKGFQKANESYMVGVVTHEDSDGKIISAEKTYRLARPIGNRTELRVTDMESIQAIESILYADTAENKVGIIKAYHFVSLTKPEKLKEWKFNDGKELARALFGWESSTYFNYSNVVSHFVKDSAGTLPACLDDKRLSISHLQVLVPYVKESTKEEFETAWNDYNTKVEAFQANQTTEIPTVPFIDEVGGHYYDYSVIMKYYDDNPNNPVRFYAGMSRNFLNQAIKKIRNMVDSDGKQIDSSFGAIDEKKKKESEKDIKVEEGEFTSINDEKSAENEVATQQETSSPTVENYEGKSPEYILSQAILSINKLEMIIKVVPGINVAEVNDFLNALAEQVQKSLTK